MSKRITNEKKFMGMKLSGKLFVPAIAFFIGFGAQAQVKLDPHFKNLINSHKSKAALPKDPKIEEKLNPVMVVTAKSAKAMYPAIIYTTNANALREKGIIVQAEHKTFVTALISEGDMQTLEKDVNVTFIEAPGVDYPDNDVSTAQSGAQLLQSGALNNTKYTGKGVLVAIFDSGIDWKHPDFRNPDDQTKSRIYRIWDQTLTPTGNEVSPAGFSYGVEYTQEQINDELDGTPAGFVREQDTNGHGSHVSGTAAGNGAARADRKHTGFAPEADIVMVKGGDGSFTRTNQINALAYLKNLSEATGKPIVVNMSIGGQSSGHDGTESTELAVDDFINSGPGRLVSISAGNDYDKIHGQFEVPANGAQSFQFTVASNTTSASIFSFICFGNDASAITAELTTPDGQVYTQDVSTDTYYPIQSSGLTAYLSNYLYSANGKRFVQLSISRPSGSTVNSQGVYTLTIRNNTANPLTYNGWVTSKTVATTLANGDTKYTVSTPGLATNSITTASYLGRYTYYSNATNGGYVISGSTAEGISSFSSEGPRLDGYLKPDITASGQNVISVMSSSAMLPTTNSDNIDNAYYRKNQGTSMASPGVAGAAALLFQANASLTGKQAKEIIRNSARTETITGTTPNTRWGYGKLDIYKAVASVVGCPTSNFSIVGYDERNYLQGSNEFNSNFTNTRFAVRMTADLTGKMGALSFFTGTGNTTSDVKLQLRTVAANGMPGDILGEKTVPAANIIKSAWQTYDFSDLNINVEYNKDYFAVVEAASGTMSLRSETYNVDNRSYSSTDGTTWAPFARDYRIRSTIFEDVPQVQSLADVNATAASNITGERNFAVASCKLVARLDKNTSQTLSGAVTSKVWVGGASDKMVGRRYEITPANNVTTATARVTLYYTQAEFDAYNAGKTVLLPTAPTDAANKQNVRIDKISGTSTDGLPQSYTGAKTTITPNVADVVWNAKYNYWEVSFDTVGFSGFFLRTDDQATLGASDTSVIKGLTVYPNPVQTELNIAGLSSGAGISIFDMGGKLVMSQILQSKTGKVNVSSLPKGLYIVKVSTADGKTQSTKVVKN